MRLNGIYDVLLLLFLFLTTPFWLWDLCKGKHRDSFFQKLGLFIPVFAPKKRGEYRIWIHAVSLGEVKAALPLVQIIREKLPHASIMFSTTTETGQQEAKKALKGLSCCFYLPLDFSWTIRKLAKRMKPDLLLLVESDLWFNLVQAAPCVALVNGKMSQKSANRYKQFRFFTRHLFEKIDLFCVQNETFKEHFLEAGASEDRVCVTGNMKLDRVFSDTSHQTLTRSQLGISSHDYLITLASTHRGEEKLLMSKLKPLFKHFSHLKLILIPRHPERFEEAASFLSQEGIEFGKFSESHFNSTQRMILMDAMGLVEECYLLSEVAIVGGSFIPGIGGHNIFEPTSLGIPVIFGPFMENQKELVQLVLEHKAGVQTNLEELPSLIENFIKHPPLTMKQAGLRLAGNVKGSTLRTWETVSKTLLQQKT